MSLSTVAVGAHLSGAVVVAAASKCIKTGNEVVRSCS